MAFRMAFLAVLCLSLPALADDACLAAPNRACLFDMAVTTALAYDDRDKAAVNLLSIALKQYASDPNGADDTIRRMIAMLQAAETKPGEAFDHLAWAVLGQGADLGKAPALAGQIARLFDGKDPLVTLTPPEDAAKISRAVLRAYALAGSLAEVDRVLGNAAAGERRDLTLLAADALMQRGDFAAAYALDDGRDGGLRATFDQTAVILLLRQDKLDAAEVAAAMTTDTAMRTASLVKVALAYAKAGSGKANEIADRIAAPSGGSKAAYVTLNLAETYGRIGDSDKAYALLKQIEPGVIPPHVIIRAQVVIALRAGDVPAALGFVDELADPRETAGAMAGIGDLLVDLRAADRSDFLAGLEPVHRAGALTAITRAYLARGDLVLADATIRDLRAADPDGKMSRFLTAPRALALMSAGEVAKAMDVARGSADGPLLAELAAML